MRAGDGLDLSELAGAALSRVVARRTLNARRRTAGRSGGYRAKRRFACRGGVLQQFPVEFGHRFAPRPGVFHRPDHPLRPGPFFGSGSELFVDHRKLRRVDGGLAVEAELEGAAGAPAEPFEVAEGEPRRVPAKTPAARAASRIRWRAWSSSRSSGEARDPMLNR